MMDMLVMALACDLTAVATLQWSDTEAKHTFPWLGLTEHHHFYQHDGGFRAGGVREDRHLVLASSTCTCCSRWQAVDMGGHSLLDESVVFFGSELQDPPSHGKTNMPFLLAGGGGGLRTGRWLKYGGRLAQRPAGRRSCNLFGDARQSFGDPEILTGRPIDFDSWSTPGRRSGVPDVRATVVEPDRFGQPLLDRGVPAERVAAVLGAEHHHRQVRQVRAGLLLAQELLAVHPRHHHVQHHDPVSRGCSCSHSSASRPSLAQWTL